MQRMSVIDRQNDGKIAQIEAGHIAGPDRNQPISCHLHGAGAQGDQLVAARRNGIRGHDTAGAYQVGRGGQLKLQILLLQKVLILVLEQIVEQPDEKFLPKLVKLTAMHQIRVAFYRFMLL
ncbi:hypothetical protein D3C77_300780 [compost metagenome]